LICDTTNPRSIAYQLIECVTHVDELAACGQELPGPVDQGITAALLEAIQSTDILKVSNEFEGGNRTPLNKLFNTIDSKIPALSDVISHRYFFHSGAVQRLAEYDMPPADGE